MSYPVAPKASAAGVSAAAAGAVLYLAQQYVFRGHVPAGVESLIYAATPGVVALAAAWLAPHQERERGWAGPRVPPPRKPDPLEPSGL